MYHQYSLNCAYGKCIIKWTLYTYSQKQRGELNSLQGFSHLDASLKAGPSNQNSTDSCQSIYIYCVVLTTYTHIDSLCRISTKQARGVKAFATEARRRRPRGLVGLLAWLAVPQGFRQAIQIEAPSVRCVAHVATAQWSLFCVNISLGYSTCV